MDQHILCSNWNIANKLKYLPPKYFLARAWGCGLDYFWNCKQRQSNYDKLWIADTTFCDRLHKLISQIMINDEINFSINFFILNLNKNLLFYKII